MSTRERREDEALESLFARSSLLAMAARSSAEFEAAKRNAEKARKILEQSRAKGGSGK